MIEGIILGAIISSFVIFVAFVASECVDYGHEKFVLIGTFIVILIITIAGGIICAKVDEESMKNENISDLEKIALVKDIVSYNTQLTELKEDVKQWWYFYLDDSKVNELDIIKID